MDNKDMQAAMAEVQKNLLQQQHIVETSLVSRVTGDEERDHPLSGTELGQGGPNGTVLVPSLTPEETSTNVSSTGKKMVAIQVPENVDAGEFRRAVAAAYLEYIISGSVTQDGVVERSRLTSARAGLILASPEFRTACQVRGIVTGTENFGINPRQDYALQIMLDTSDGLSFGRKLKKAGVSNSEFQAWLKNPLFAQHYQRVTEGLLNDSRPAMIQLVSKANEGDLQSIKFMLEVNGRHNPARQQSVDMMMVMNRIMEVLARNVEPAQLVPIAKEMAAIGESIGLSSQRTIEG